MQEAQEKVNEIYSQENPELKAVEQKVTDILKEVPTFAADAENLQDSIQPHCGLH